jgi:hypothetical protein
MSSFWLPALRPPSTVQNGPIQGWPGELPHSFSGDRGRGTEVPPPGAREAHRAPQESALVPSLPLSVVVAGVTGSVAVRDGFD